MRGVDHDPLRFAALARQFGENLVEHPQAAPENEPIVDRLVRAILSRSVAQRSPFLITKTMALTIRRSSTRAIPCESGKYRSIRRICAWDSKNKSAMAKPPRLAYESANPPLRKNLIGPELDPECALKLHVLPPEPVQRARP